MKTFGKITGLLFLGILLVFGMACSEDEAPTGLATVTTSAVTNIEFNSATSGGEITNNGGSAVSVSGVCWSTNHNPTTAGPKTTDGTKLGIFTSSMTNLNGSTTYYVRAYATNDKGTAYGNEVQFITPIDK